MHSGMLVLPILALAFCHALAQPKGEKVTLFSCDVTKYVGVIYKKDNIHGPDQGMGANSLEECVEKCLMTAKCTSINFVSSQNFCMMLKSSNAADFKDFKSSTHASISCTVPKPSKPVGCGKQAPQFLPNGMNQRVVGGSEAKAHSWPWATLLDIDLRNGYKSTCGSTLIRVKDNVEASDIIVTAAHCVTVRGTSGALLADQITAIAGNHRRDKYEAGEQLAIGAKILVHPQYKPSPINDIALVKLDRPIVFSDTVRPACLPAQGEALPVKKICAAAGWGRNNSYNEQEMPMALLQLRTPAHDGNTCKRGWAKYDENAMVCAGPLDASADTCEGDSGGMLACQNPDGWTLYGATSFGASGTCLAKNAPGVYTRISSYRDWIDKEAKAMTSL